MDILKHSKYKKLYYYSLHGIGTTIISLATYQFFLYIKMQYIIAFSLSWIFANSYAYFSTRRSVFDSNADTGKQITKEYFKFMCGRFVTYIVNALMLFVAVDFMHYDPFISNIFISLIIIVLNYFIGNFIIKGNDSSLSEKFDIDEI
ncbi:MAG: GtrA family protein [Clostridia bacterium]